MQLYTQFALASDAAQLAIIGGAFWLIAGFALLMEQLRVKRRKVERLERVGWVPWTGVFLSTFVIGGGCLVMSLPIVLLNL